MAGPLLNQSWSGPKQGPATWTKAGPYGGGQWSVQVPLNDAQHDAATIAGSGVQLHDLTAQHGRRAISVHHPTGQTLQNVGLYHVTAQNAGVPGSPHGSAGQGVYADNLLHFVMQGVTATGNAGHGLYIALTAHDCHLLNCVFRGAGHAPCAQWNSGDGGQGFWKQLIEACEFHSTGQTVLNLLGAGWQNDPMAFRGCTIDGAGFPRAVVVSNYAAPRGSYAVFDGCHINGGLVVEGPSVAILKNGTTVSGPQKTSGGGKIVKG